MADAPAHGIGAAPLDDLGAPLRVRRTLGFARDSGIAGGECKEAVMIAWWRMAQCVLVIQGEGSRLSRRRAPNAVLRGETGD